jgi:pyridoxamine 5'-phosphate oxidase family protein
MFSDKEINYLKSQRLARIATVSGNLQPDVAPVGLEFDGESFYIGGLQQTKTFKYENVAAGNSKVALAIDDWESIDPWKPRGIKIHGDAEIVERPGTQGPAPYLKVKPLRVWSWGIERKVFENGKPVISRKAAGD